MINSQLSFSTFETPIIAAENVEIEVCNSTSDYWRLIADNDGHLRLYYDGFEDIVDENGNLLVAEDEETAGLYQIYLDLRENGANPDAIFSAKARYLNSRQAIRNSGYALDRAFHMLVGNTFNSDNPSNASFPGFVNWNNRGSQYNDVYQPLADDLTARGLMKSGYIFTLGGTASNRRRPGFNANLSIDVTNMWDLIGGLNVDKRSILNDSFLANTNVGIFTDGALYRINQHGAINWAGSNLNSDQRINALRMLYDGGTGGSF